jgi:3-oxoacyl-[acyl-carrier protein] reductase
VRLLLVFPGQPAGTTGPEALGHWQAVLDSELTAAYRIVRVFLPGMRARGTGAIVTVSSAGPGAGYAVAAAGLAALTRHLAAELAGTGVRVNCLAGAGHPGPVPPDERDRRLAATAAFLVSTASAGLTGVTLDLAGATG